MRPQKTRWQLRIPLGDLPPKYRTYALTVSTSPDPLSRYLSLPLSTISPTLPPALFVHPSTPISNASLAKSGQPLMHWHVTHFPSEGGQLYSCIGFGRSHGVFDGTAAALIVRALEAEMHGRTWDVPPLPEEGPNVNALQQALDNVVEAAGGAEKVVDEREYGVYTVMGIWAALKFVAGHVWERWWWKAAGRIVILPQEAIAKLVDGVRTELDREDAQAEPVRVTTGDVLLAWMLKVSTVSGSHAAYVIPTSSN